MTYKMFKWCPKGCGKKVKFNPSLLYKNKREPGTKCFECPVCNKVFSKEEINANK